MTHKEKIAWDSIKDWLQKFDNDECPYEGVPAADLLTLMHEAEVEKNVDNSLKSDSVTQDFGGRN